MANKKAKGKRAKTRCKFKRKARDKTTINEIIKPVAKNDIVQIKINSAYHDGIPHKRMHGLTGKVIGFQGECPIVQLKDGNKTKKIVAHRIHLKMLNYDQKGEDK
jgi:large subunit ribosomal protein L21e